MKIADLVIPFCIVLLSGSMVVPFPPVVLDFLLTGNLLLALLLLLSTFYISEPLKLSCLPTILLLTAVVRLALNVSTTRQILGTGHSGKVIETFGKFVVDGNLTVGIVVFAVVTLVQFLVVAKGGERVAEVSARFALDALPGKQMSIDADVRAGVIDYETARVKRQELQVESRFYGALDGAMKFVKGDAIAGVIIACVNAFGGLGVGLLQEGLDVSTAVSKYTLLTVGDGLLSQIPSLFNSVAAGIMVTRVSRESSLTLGRELFSQMGQVQSARIYIAFVSILLALIPGMPVLPCLLFSISLFLVAAFETSKARGVPKSPAKLKVKSIPLLSLTLKESFSRIPKSIELLEERLELTRQAIYDDTGLVISRPEIVWIKDGTQRLLARGLTVDTFELEGELLVEAVGKSFYSLIHSRRTEFIDDIYTRRLLDLHDNEFPELIAAVVPGVVSITQLTIILKELSTEEVSLRNFDLILQVIAEQAQKSFSLRNTIEEIRGRLGPFIKKSLEDNEGRIQCLTIDPLLDLLCARAEREGHLLDTNKLEELFGFVEENLGKGASLVVSKGARALVRDYARVKKIPIKVISYEELGASNLCPVAHLTLERREDALDLLAA